MWLVGVVIRRYIDILIIIINFPYSTCIRSFFGSNKLYTVTSAYAQAALAYKFNFCLSTTITYNEQFLTLVQ